MNKQEYLKTLKKQLKGVPEEEVISAMEYCEEYFDEAGSDEMALLELGTPTKFAAIVRADAIVNSQGDQKGLKALLKHIKDVFKGICSLPLSKLGLLFLIIIYFLFLMGIIVVAVALFISIFVCFISSVPLFILACTKITMIGDSLVSLGAGFVCAGLGVLMACLCYGLIHYAIPSFYRYIINYYRKVKGDLYVEK